MEKNSLLRYITCPLTKLIFCDPVLADDGYFYEYMAIKNHLLKSNISPITNEKIGNQLCRVPIIKKMTDEFINNNPEFQTDQFLFKKPFYLFDKEFIDLLKNKQFDKLKEFTSIILSYEYGKDTLFELICRLCPIDIIKHIIDNSIDYDAPDRRKLTPIHIACKYAPLDIVIYLANKGVDLENEDSNCDRPLGYLIYHRPQEQYKEIIHEFLKFGINVNYFNKSGLMPAHYIINNGDIDTLKLLLDYNLDLNIISPKLGGLNLLQYSFKYCANPDLIKYLINLNINLDVDVDPFTSCEQLIYQNELIHKKTKQFIVLHYLTKLLSKAVIEENFIDNIKK